MDRNGQAIRRKLEDPAYMTPDEDEMEDPYVILSNPLSGTTTFQSESGAKLALSFFVIFSIIIIVAFVLVGLINGFPLWSYFLIIGILAFFGLLFFVQYAVGRENAEEYKRKRSKG
jgi:lipopolysaccharide export LptBFGC system permease protein LptF